MREVVFCLEAEREGDRGPERGAVWWACIWLRAVPSAAISATVIRIRRPTRCTSMDTEPPSGLWRMALTSRLVNSRSDNDQGESIFSRPFGGPAIDATDRDSAA